MTKRIQKKVLRDSYWSTSWFSLVILLVACPLWGQVNKNIKAHLEANQLFIEISQSQLETPMLIVKHEDNEAQFQQVVWSKHGDFIQLENRKITSLAGIIIPISKDPHVESHVLGIFPIIKEKSSSLRFYINVTQLLFSSDVGWEHGSKENIEEATSFIEGVQYMDKETIVTTKLTKVGASGTKIMDVAFSFYSLPKPMKPRLFDYRMGFFIEDQWSNINHISKAAKASITRWRLEKKYKEKKVSEPITPITFYLDSKIPDSLKPYCKAGILEWLPAFEAAGFKNAIEVKDIPVDTTNWPINSVQTSIVRWENMSNIRGFELVSGGTVRNIIDFRSGEILKSDIVIGSFQQALAASYFARCASLDSRAQQYPFPNELMGALFQSLVAHEAGHAFGIKDGHFGEYTYPYERMRDEHWLSDMGYTPSVMNYSRYNYIVQPEDNIPPSLLMQSVGPADVYQIKWAYKEIPEAHTPEEELPYLEELVSQQDTIPWYRYQLNNYEIIGPGATNEVMDNNDPMKSTTMGLKNIKRVLSLLRQFHEEYDEDAFVGRTYEEVLNLWYHQMKQVMSLIGGYTVYFKSGKQSKNTYTPISYKKQENAMAFIGLHAFQVPEDIMPPDYVSKMHYATNPDELLDKQIKLLLEFLDSRRMQRLLKMEASTEFKGITKKLLSQLQSDLFYELSDEILFIDARQQEIQMAYIGFMVKAIMQEKKYESITSDWSYYLYNEATKSMFFSQLEELRTIISKQMPKVKDKITLIHLKRCLNKMNILVMD